MFRTFTDVVRPPVVEQPGSMIDRLYICDLCTEGWSSETEVEFHRSEKHKSIIRDMINSLDPICKMCMTEYASENDLLRHINSAHLLSSERALRVERDIFVCDNCGDLFFNKHMLIHHILSAHSDKPKNCKFKCPKCLKGIRLDTCWYHFLQHKLQSVSVCKICLTKCRDRITLAQHLKNHPYVYKCEMCGYETKKKELFDSHILRQHKPQTLTPNATDESWKRCFPPARTLKKWQRINLMGWKGVRLSNDVSICVLCREICVGEESMKRHVLLDHAGDMRVAEVDYRCKCGMVFTSKVLYKHHIFKFKEQHGL